MEKAEIQFKGQVKIRDWWYIGFRNFLLSILLIIPIITLVIVVFLGMETSFACIICIIIPLVMAALIIWFIIFFLMLLFSTHQMKTQKIFEPVSGSVSQEGIHIQQIDVKADLSWIRYYKYKKFANSILLYTSPYSFQIFPKHLFLNDSDWLSFIDLVNTCIQKKKNV